MSSLFNQTTGECISGTCQSLTQFSNISFFQITLIVCGGAILIALIMILYGWCSSAIILTRFT